MANESQYYNPIIQAMIATAQNQQAQARTEIEAKTQKAEQSAREAQLAQTEKALELNHDIESRRLEQNQQILDAQNNLRQLQEIEAARNIHLAGGDLTQFPQLLAHIGLQGAQPAQQPQQPQQFSPGSSSIQNLFPQPAQPAQPQPAAPLDLNKVFGTPEQNIALLRQRAAAQAGGQAEGALPSQMVLENLRAQNEQALTTERQRWETGENSLNRQTQEKIASASRNTQLLMNNADNATRLEMGKMQYQPSPEMLQAMTVGSMTGTVKLNPANPREAAALAGVIQAGAKPLAPNDITALKAANQLGPLFDQLQSFAEKQPSSGIMAYGKGLVLRGAEKAGIQTDTETQLQEIASKAVQLGKTVEAMSGGRVLSKQLDLDLNSLIGSNNTKAQALSKLNNIKQMFLNQVDQNLLGGVPKEQQELLYLKQGIKPGWLIAAPKANSAGYKLDEQKSIELGKPAYVGK